MSAAGEPDKPQRFRAPKSLWDEFGRKAEAANSDRSKELRKFVEWYVGRPKARRPVRPEPESD